MKTVLAMGLDIHFIHLRSRHESALPLIMTHDGASAARWYWEFGQFLATAGAAGPPPPVKVPVGFTTFPDEIWAAPRSWVETVYPGVAYFNQ